MSASPDYYESTGTIHLKIEGEKIENIFFVPDKDHSVKHQGKEYAVFLPEGSCRDAPEGSCRDAKVVSFKKGLDLVKLKLNNSTMKTSLRDAARHQSMVDVKVKLGDKKLKVIGITVPALSAK